MQTSFLAIMSVVGLSAALVIPVNRPSLADNLDLPAVLGEVDIPATVANLPTLPRQLEALTALPSLVDDLDLPVVAGGIDMPATVANLPVARQLEALTALPNLGSLADNPELPPVAGEIDTLATVAKLPILTRLLEALATFPSLSDYLSFFRPTSSGRASSPSSQV